MNDTIEANAREARTLISTKNMVSTMFYALASTLVLLPWCSANVDFTDFVELSTPPPQDFSEIELGPTCPIGANFSGMLDITSFVVEPVKANAVVIKTYPPDLLDVSAIGGVLRFQYNDVSQQVHNGTGVLIQVPENQLKGIRSAPQSVSRSWILNGFTQLRSINLRGWNSQLVVEMDSSVGRVEIFHGGQSNSIFLGHGAEVDIDVVGSSHAVSFNATIKAGTISATKSLLWTNGGIDQLSVTGDQNRVLASKNEACGNVQLHSERSSCEYLGSRIRAPEMIAVSEAKLFVTCPAILQNASPPSAASIAAVKPAAGIIFVAMAMTGSLL